MTTPSRRRVGKALDAMRQQHSALLIEAAAPFARVANIIDALPNSHRPGDAQPLRNSMPGAWPAVGDVRKLRDELVRLGWKP